MTLQAMHTPSIVAEPLLGTGLAPQEMDLRSETWCWSIAHYEEHLDGLRWRLTHVPQHTVGHHVAHLHKHGEECTDKCMHLTCTATPRAGGVVV